MKKVIISSICDDKTYVKLDMAGYYHGFINAVPDDSKDRDSRFQNGVALIVWGAFYLEAATNETSIKILEDGVHGILKNADMVWSFIERATTERKFEFILDSLMSDEELKNKYKRSFAKLFKLRNRLAHYKEPRQEAVLSRKKSDVEDVNSKLSAANKIIPQHCQ